ncbi:hypothetical protein PRUPE_6G077500 [Prunus persica]|uniref:F-box domain-containing protein n=1 Tax=Prunus persica TaxID=3760 RepID=A0A251NLQ4_PRUPE|nr:uncharacterized protein LOC109949471 [Prunus persica]ONI00236.1 hypothetical protein PRUPE_6G077500 [Prunus persica]
MMWWYLSRTPSSASNAKPSDQYSTITLHNSIFPVSDSGLFNDICIVEIPNKPLIDHNKDNNKSSSKQVETFPCSSWEWFAYQFSPTQFHSVVVPRVLSPVFRIQVIGVLPEHFLCAKLVQSPHQPHATLCTYSCSENSLHDVPKMNCEDRNPFGAACALRDDWLYVAGGYKGKSSNIDPSSYLNSVERLNLKTWEWQSLQNMQEPRAFADGFTHKGRFFVVGGSATLKHSAEIYNPSTNSWVCLKSFVPKEADGFTAASLNGRLMLLTWSDQLGVKLWLWTVLVNPNLICRCRLISFFPNQIVERPRLKSHGAKMVQVGGKEVWVLVGESDRFCLQVDGSNALPVFPAPMFRPGDGHEAVQKGHIYAFSFTDGVGLSWRKIPVYSI